MNCQRQGKLQVPVNCQLRQLGMICFSTNGKTLHCWNRSLRVALRLNPNCQMKCFHRFLQNTYKNPLRVEFTKNDKNTTSLHLRRHEASVSDPRFTRSGGSPKISDMHINETTGCRLLRMSYRSGSGVKKLTVANVSQLPPRQLDELKKLLAAKRMVRGTALESEVNRQLFAFLLPLIKPGQEWRLISVPLDCRRRPFEPLGLS